MPAGWQLMEFPASVVLLPAGHRLRLRYAPAFYGHKSSYSVSALTDESNVRLFEFLTDRLVHAGLSSRRIPDTRPTLCKAGTTHHMYGAKLHGSWLDQSNI